MKRPRNGSGHCGSRRGVPNGMIRTVATALSGSGGRGTHPAEPRTDNGCCARVALARPDRFKQPGRRVSLWARRRGRSGGGHSRLKNTLGRWFRGAPHHAERGTPASGPANGRQTMPIAGVRYACSTSPRRFLAEQLKRSSCRRGARSSSGICLASRSRLLQEQYRTVEPSPSLNRSSARG